MSADLPSADLTAADLTAADFTSSLLRSASSDLAHSLSLSLSLFPLFFQFLFSLKARSGHQRSRKCDSWAPNAVRSSKTVGKLRV